VVNEQPSELNQLAGETKQARREKRRAKKKAKVPQHGKSLARVYQDALTKRAKPKQASKQSN